MTINDIRQRIENDKTHTRSAWNNGVKLYASDLLDQLQEAQEGGCFDPARILEPRYLRTTILNGATDWTEYSWGGCALIYNGDIAERLCTPSELKKTRNGERRPNSREEWLDTQARALRQAANRIFCAAKELTWKEAAQ